MYSLFFVLQIYSPVQITAAGYIKGTTEGGGMRGSDGWGQNRIVEEDKIGETITTYTGC